MGIIAINAKKGVIYVAVAGTSPFRVLHHQMVSYEPDGTDGLLQVDQAIHTVIDDHAQQCDLKVAVILACAASGPSFHGGSAPATIKAEGIAELAALKAALEVRRVSASALKKALGCKGKEPWNVAAFVRLYPLITVGKTVWKNGMDGAVAAAFAVAQT